MCSQHVSALSADLQAVSWPRCDQSREQDGYLQNGGESEERNRVGLNRVGCKFRPNNSPHGKLGLN